MKLLAFSSGVCYTSIVMINVQPVTQRTLGRFIAFPDRLYRADRRYVPYMKADLKRTLKHLLFEEQTYHALLALDGRGRVCGRVLYTIDSNKRAATDRCGFFSMYECVDDLTVSRALLSAMQTHLRALGAVMMEGPYFPYDQDNRRGFLAEGFDRPPLILTSYNPPYYIDQMHDFGLCKQTDALAYAIEAQPERRAWVGRLAQRAMKRSDFRIDVADMSRVEDELRDIHTVMEAADTDVIYQQTPSMDTLRTVAVEWRRFLDPELILIARRNSDNAPIGVVMALPDWFEVFRAMRGRMDARGVIAFLRTRRHIHAVRAILQYVIPAYQSRGVNAALYNRLWQTIEKRRIDYVEVGTIMEKNALSNESIRSVCGRLARVYRIFYKNFSKEESLTSGGDAT